MEQLLGSTWLLASEKYDITVGAVDWERSLHSNLSQVSAVPTCAIEATPRPSEKFLVQVEMEFRVRERTAPSTRFRLRDFCGVVFVFDIDSDDAAEAAELLLAECQLSDVETALVTRLLQEAADKLKTGRRQRRAPQGERKDGQGSSVGGSLPHREKLFPWHSVKKWKKDFSLFRS